MRLDYAATILLIFFYDQVAGTQSQTQMIRRPAWKRQALEKYRVY